LSVAIGILLLGLALVVYLACLDDARVTTRVRFWNALCDLAVLTNNDQLYVYAMRHRP
jgi:hypothetical protein